MSNEDVIGEAAREAALHFEAVKVSMRMDSKGCYITLSIHPAQVPTDLLISAAGSRFMVAMVNIGHDEMPVKGKDQTIGEKAVKIAGALCRNPKFQKWMENRGFSMLSDEESVADGLKRYCQIDSRAELATNENAREKFFRIKESFENEYK